MTHMEAALVGEGYRVWNLDYPSRSAPVAELARLVIPPAVEKCRDAGASTIHFVTHSMGGILVRHHLAHHAMPELGRVVMLGPPNRGSEVVDVLGASTVFNWINGPAGRELGTGLSSVPNQLGEVHFSLGVIAGNRSINWINSLLIRGSDDGKVSVERTKCAGMTGHWVVPVAHPFLPRSRAAISQTICFLRSGRFNRPVVNPRRR